MRAGWFLLLALPAQAEKDLVLLVVVTDAAGAPVKNAVVVFPSEGQRHRVNSEDGSWRGVRLYLADGTETPFQKGVAVQIMAAAPGYAPTSVDYTVGKSDKPLTVPLQPLAAPTLGCVPAEMALDPEHGDAISRWADAKLNLPGPRDNDTAWCLLGARSYGAWLDWQAKSLAYTAAPTDESNRAQWSAQIRTFQTSRDWLEWSATNAADITVAASLCQVATESLAPCT